MKTRLRAGLLALPLSLLCASTASAQYPGCAGGGYGSGPFPMTPTCHMPCPNFSCGGFCLNLFGRIHFHGPLFNYGPYYGYYPFEPYGPWTSDLRYNPPQNCGKGGCGGDKVAWGQYAKDTLRNVFHRLNPGCHKAKGCSTCSDTVAAPAAGGCAGCTALLTQPAPVQTVGAATVLTGLTR